MISKPAYERGHLMNQSSRNDKFDYFKAYERQTGYAKELVLNLKSAIETGELGSYELMRALHVIENDADEVNHLIQERLLHDFVVPLERRSMVELAHALDDLCDTVEQIAIDSYICKAEAFDPVCPFGMKELVSLLEQGTLCLTSGIELMRSYGRERARINRFCTEVQNCESEADDVYIAAVRALYENERMCDRELRIKHKLLEAVENAMDAAENAAEMVEGIIAENV